MTEATCECCNAYMPLNLAGTARVHDCDFTPPSDGLPHGVCACPVCGGYGLYRWGCVGTEKNPHEHAFMMPIRELVADPTAEGSNE